MAENPATWGEAEHVIARTLDKFYDAVHGGQSLAGFSLPKQIANALREAGLLKEED